MKSFLDAQNQTFTFSSCEICDAMCCDGKRGTTFSQLILKDFKEVYENFPIAFLLGDLGFLKPVVLLTNGQNFCRYLKDSKCTIYEKRPSVCRIYPLSPHLTNTTFIDTLCPAVNTQDEQNTQVIIENGKATKNFMHPSLDNYLDKYIDMHEHFEKFNKKENLEHLITIGTNEFYKFKEDFGDEYIKLHLSSLKNLDSYFKV